MTTQNANTPDSGLIELSKMRESIMDASGTSTGPDLSLLSEHVPTLRVDKPRRSRVSALGVATAASVLLGLTSAAYALHHEVTQHMFRTQIEGPNIVKPILEAEPVAFVTPQRIEDPSLGAIAETLTSETALSETVRVIPTAIPTARADSAPWSRSTTPRPNGSSAPRPVSAERSIDELLHGATGGQVTTREGSTRPAESSLPLRPARAHVSSSFRGVTRAIQACGDGAEGVVSARASVDGPSGRVRSVSLSGVSGEAERCMERALMGVRVDPFAQDHLEVTFPYRL